MAVQVCTANDGKSHTLFPQVISHSTPDAENQISRTRFDVDTRCGLQHAGLGKKEARQGVAKSLSTDHLGI